MRINTHISKLKKYASSDSQLILKTNVYFGHVGIIVGIRLQKFREFWLTATKDKIFSNDSHFIIIRL